MEVPFMNTTLAVDPKLDISLRPNSWEFFVGQDQARRALTIFSEAARRRGDSLGHCLITGPSGCGKTTLAGILAASAGRKLHIVNCANIEQMSDFVESILTLEPGDYILMDEFHALPPKFQEGLYHACEDATLDCMYQGRLVHLNLPPFTLLAATTREGVITKPMLNRFEITQRVNFYEPSELAQIIQQSAVKLHIEVADDAVDAIAKRARGTPRICNTLLKRCRDYADVEGNGNGIVELAEVNATMSMLEIDGDGLDALDRAILRLLGNSTRPLGIKSIASALQEDLRTIEDQHEPYLMFAGFVSRLANGRTLTEKGKAKVKL